MLDIEEASVKANLTKSHLRQLLREGKIKGIKSGKEWRIAREELNKYLGIKTDIQSLEKDIYIKELEGKVRYYQFVLDTVKGNLSNIEVLLHNGN